MFLVTLCLCVHVWTSSYYLFPCSELTLAVKDFNQSAWLEILEVSQTFSWGVHFPFPSFLPGREVSGLHVFFQTCWAMLGTVLFSLGQCTKMPGHGAQAPFLSPPLLEKSLGYVPNFAPADVIQLLRTASSAKIHIGCWDLHYLPSSLPSAGDWAGFYVLHQLPRATHASLYLAAPKHSISAKFLSTLGGARQEISQAAFQKLGL